MKNLKNYKERLLKLIKERSYRQGKFVLSSGLESNHYVNCKPVILSGEGLSLVSHLLLELVDKESVAVAGLTLGADPLVSGVAMASHSVERPKTLDALIVRKQPKGHGTEAWIEGPTLKTGSKVTILEDVITTGGSSVKAALKIIEAGYIVDTIISIIDRQEGGDRAIMDAGFKSLSLFKLEDLADAKDE